MHDANKLLKEQFDKYKEMGMNSDVSFTEAMDRIKSERKAEFAQAKDLNQAKKDRKDAIAKRLNALREEAGAKQKEVADAIGVNVITLSGYEVGRSEPNAEVFVRLADYYKVSLDYVLCRTDTRIVFDKDEYQTRDEERKMAAERLRLLEAQMSELKEAMK